MSEQNTIQTGRLRTRRLLTVIEYAELTGIPAQTVRAQLRERRLRGRDLNAGNGKRARWRVFVSEAERNLRSDEGR